MRSWKKTEQDKATTRYIRLEKGDIKKMFEALYDPCFEPPSKWLRGFLLFFDKINSIVPSDVDFKPSSELSEIIDVIPDGFKTISPREEDISLDDLNLNRMRKACEVI